MLQRQPEPLIAGPLMMGRGTTWHDVVRRRQCMWTAGARSPPEPLLMMVDPGPMCGRAACAAEGGGGRAAGAGRAIVAGGARDGLQPRLQSRGVWLQQGQAPSMRALVRCAFMGAHRSAHRTWTIQNMAMMFVPIAPGPSRTWP